MYMHVLRKVRVNNEGPDIEDKLNNAIDEVKKAI